MADFCLLKKSGTLGASSFSDVYEKSKYSVQSNRTIMQKLVAFRGRDASRPTCTSCDLSQFVAGRACADLPWHAYGRRLLL